ncbi:MAG: lamin tail domain-containing protein [Methanotrichaceae archaeon]
MRNSTFAQIVLLVSAFSIVSMGLGAADVVPQLDANVIISDLSYEDEWAEITNPGMATQDFTYWTLVDEENNTYMFPEGFALAPDAIVKVHTGTGDDTESDLYLGNEEPIWDEDEMVILIDASGEVVSQFPE